MQPEGYGGTVRRTSVTGHWQAGESASPYSRASFGDFHLYFPGFDYFNDFGDRLGQPSVPQSSKSPLVRVFNELCGQ